MGLGAIASIALLAVIVPPSGIVHGAQTAAHVRSAAAPTQTFEALTFRGTSSPQRAITSALSVQVAAPAASEHFVSHSKRGNTAADVKPAMFRRNLATQAALPIPTPKLQDVSQADAGFYGFRGLSHFDQRHAGTGIYTNTQFSLEPPDQGLCVGNDFVMETINNALAVYDEAGNPVVAPTALSQFFGVTPEYKAGVYGAFLSDPRCRFDQDTQRWFVTELEIDTTPSGNFSNHSSTLIAVSQSNDPAGSYNVYSFDTTDASHPGCPCFGDQPLIGEDRYGFYVSTNEFPLFVNGFNGDQIYAISKAELAKGLMPAVVHIDAGALPAPSGGIWYSIQPASYSPTGVSESATGVEYFLSALDFVGLGDNRIATWALSNTHSLVSKTPKLTLQYVLVNSRTYSPPVPITQKAGPIPLGASVKNPEGLLNSNDDRMNQVAFGGGVLWAGVNTAVNSSGAVRDGVEYFGVKPQLTNGVLSATMADNGYVATRGENLAFPSIAVNGSGEAVLAASLAGPDYFPSVVYSRLNRGSNAIRLAELGSLPDDGFTIYSAFGGNGVGRWGDYTAAVADFDGNLWFAVEDTTLPRTFYANWGTFIGHVQAAAI